MRRIHFSASDIARTRLRATVGPVAETVFAADLLRGQVPPALAPWRRMVGPRVEHLADGDMSAGDELLRQHAGQDAAPARFDRPADRAANRLRGIWRLGVAPFWPRIVTVLRALHETFARTAVTGGVESLLGTLHPHIVWRPPVLWVSGAAPGDTYLDGDGLVLCPSVFLGVPGQVVHATGEGAVVLAFGISAGAGGPGQLWGAPRRPDEHLLALGALVGRTRAAALRALRTSATTTELAGYLGISAAGASQHTAVLRRSGLIDTRRVRNTVLHSVTPLGLALLGTSKEPPSGTPTGAPTTVDVM